jgi:hypothetical protein
MIDSFVNDAMLNICKIYLLSIKIGKKYLNFLIKNY